MQIDSLNLTPGEWFYSNCADTPSVNNCKVVILAPKSQKEDLIAAGIEHLIYSHGHSREDAMNIIEEHSEEIFKPFVI